MAATAQLDTYLLGYQNTANSLLMRIAELQSYEYPTSLSLDLLGILDKAVKESKKIVKRLSDQNSNRLETTISLHSQFLLEIHNYVHLIGSSTGVSVPRWSVEPLKAEVKKYIGDENIDILVVGSNEGGNFAYDYSLDNLPQMLEDVFGSKIAKEILSDKIPKHTAIFHFPSRPIA
jgi:hypothetical protein